MACVRAEIEEQAPVRGDVDEEPETRRDEHTCESV